MLTKHVILSLFIDLPVKDEFESFADNLELNLDSIALRNQYLIVVLGDFNAQTKDGTPKVKQLMKALELMVLRLNSDWN